MSVTAIEVLDFEKIRSKHTLMRPHIDSIHNVRLHEEPHTAPLRSLFARNASGFPQRQSCRVYQQLANWLRPVFSYVPAMKLWPLSLLFLWERGPSDRLVDAACSRRICLERERQFDVCYSCVRVSRSPLSEICAHNDDHGNESNFQNPSLGRNQSSELQCALCTPFSRWAYLRSIEIIANRFSITANLAKKQLERLPDR